MIYSVIFHVIYSEKILQRAKFQKFSSYCVKSLSRTSIRISEADKDWKNKHIQPQQRFRYSNITKRVQLTLNVLGNAMSVNRSTKRKQIHS